MWKSALLAVCAAQAVQREEPSFECMDPLFRGQWYTGDSDVAQLAPRPASEELQTCGLWSGRSSCCTANLEFLQRRAFVSRRLKLDADLQVLQSYLAAMEDVARSEAYVQAQEYEQKLLNRSIKATDEAISLAEPCLGRVMAFVAGMICFSCQPTWSAYVWRNGVGEVVGVNIKPESCIYVDRGCGPFGRAVRKAYLHIMESKLAKRSHKPLPDFSMYFSRVEMCQWLRNFLAMQPIVFEARSVQRRLAQNSTTSSPFRTAALPRAIARATALPTAAPRTQAPLEATKAALALDPAEDGLHTDFEVQFPPP